MWYEDLNFLENPFKDNPDTELIGYGDIIDDLLYNLGAGNIIVLEGKEGKGKTALLKVAINKFKGDGKVVYINGSKVEDPNIETVLINKYGFFGRLFNALPRNMILLMDEVDVLNEKNLERIKYFYDQNYIKSIVFASRDKDKVKLSPSLKERVAKIITLKEISEDDAYRIIKSRLGEVELFSRDDIKHIFKASNKNIKKFLQNCEAIAELIVEKKLKNANDEVMQEVLGKKVEKDDKKTEEIKPEGQIKIIYDKT